MSLTSWNNQKRLYFNIKFHYFNIKYINIKCNKVRKKSYKNVRIKKEFYNVQ